MKNVYRVNYYVGGQPKSAFVCAPTDSEASAFLGVRDGSAQVSLVAPSVEVIGLDTPHAALVPPEPTRVPPEPPAEVRRSEHESLRQEVAELRELLTQKRSAAR